MLDSVSPYALLSASKPQRAPVSVTAYDLYSVSQRPVAESAVPHQSINQTYTPQDTCISTVQPAYTQTKKTHYIPDIHTKHTSASTHTIQRDCPLPSL